MAIYSATHPKSIPDRLLSSFTVGILTVPPYVAGLLLLLLFTVWLPIFPALGAGNMSEPVEYLTHLVLPTVALAIGWLGYLARLLRTSLLEVLSSDYIRTARAYGVSPGKIYFKYALKNAMVPTIAITGVAFGNLIGSAIFVEIIFGRVGLGSLAYNAIVQRNYPIVRGTVFVLALMFIVANLIADIAYRSLDPRLRGAAGS